VDSLERKRQSGWFVFWRSKEFRKKFTTMNVVVQDLRATVDVSVLSTELTRPHKVHSDDRRRDCHEIRVASCQNQASQVGVVWWRGSTTSNSTDPGKKVEEDPTLKNIEEGLNKKVDEELKKIGGRKMTTATATAAATRKRAPSGEAS